MTDSKFKTRIDNILHKIHSMKKSLKDQFVKIKHLEKELHSLSTTNKDLETKISVLKHQLNSKQETHKNSTKTISIPILLEEYVENETLLNLLMAAKEYIKNHEGEKSACKKSRPIDVLKTLTQKYTSEIQKYEKHRDSILTAANKDDWKNTKDALQFFQLERKQAQNNHYQIQFSRDESYRTTEASTRSDKKGAKNEASDLKHVFFI